MNDTYAAIISLIKSALTGEAVSVSDEVDWDLAFKICKSHQIVPLVFYGITNSGLEFPQKKAFFERTMQAVMQEQQQLHTLQEIGRVFSKAGIDYMPLKGSVLKALYPKTEMRTMSDMDIMVRIHQLAQVDFILEQMGCQRGKDVDHVVVYQKPPYINLEMHKRLIPSYDRDYYDYFKDAWSKAEATPENPHHYVMRREDMFLFVFAHLAKHYREGGIGLRHLVDIWVLLTRYPDMDMEYIRAELKVLQMDVFFDHVVYTLQNWFADAPATEMTAFLTDRTFASGSYGTVEQHQTAVAVRISENLGGAKKGRFIELFHAVFMPLGEMKKRYPVLHKAPILLPFLWVVRWLTAIFVQPKNIKNRAERLQRINETKVDAYTAELEYVGLKFDLRE